MSNQANRLTKRPVAISHNITMSSSPPQSKQFGRFVRYHAPALLWGATILAASSIPSAHLPEVGMIGIDKVAHLTVYGFFAWLLSRSASQLFANMALRKSVLVSALFLVLFALFDEFYQQFVPGRMSDWYDIAADLAGGLVGLLISVKKRLQ